jgi:lipoprotein-releasing system ATP-binding protein
MIQVKNLQKTFLKDGHRIEVLKGLDFEIAEGQSLAVAGVSGAGKSTLIHIIGTLDHPTSGAVLFDGVDVFTWPEKRLAAFRNRKIGFVFQFHRAGKRHDARPHPADTERGGEKARGGDPR